MKVPYKIFNLFLFALLLSCNSKPSNKLEDIKGSWFYFFEDFYFELHITDTHFIYQSELMGTEIKTFSIEKDGSIKLFQGENDSTPISITVIKLEKNRAIIKQDAYELSLQKLDLKKIDLSKLLEVDSPYYKDFLKSYRKRRKLHQSISI